MKYAIIAAALIAAPAFADDCQETRKLYDTYSSAVQFALAVSESCRDRATSTCAEVLEPLQGLLGEISLDQIQFLVDLRDKECGD